MINGLNHRSCGAPIVVVVVVVSAFSNRDVLPQATATVWRGSYPMDASCSGGSWSGGGAGGARRGATGVEAASGSSSTLTPTLRWLGWCLPPRRYACSILPCQVSPAPKSSRSSVALIPGLWRPTRHTHKTCHSIGPPRGATCMEVRCHVLGWREGLHWAQEAQVRESVDTTLHITFCWWKDKEGSVPWL
jgi:hypothetical protein